jgi:hypothetical protein
MRGSDSNHDQKKIGLIPLSIKEIFDVIKADEGREYSITVSYLEVNGHLFNDL